MTAPPANATQLSISPTSYSTGAGAALKFTVTALDATGAVVPSYAGTVQLTSSDPQVSFQPSSSLTLANGTGASFVTFKTAGSQTITATDAAKALVSAGISVSITPAAVSSLSVTTPSSAASIGLPIPLTVNALDAYGNVATSYAGTVQLSSSDAQASFQPSSSLTLAAGTGSTSVTFKTIGNQTVTAADPATASLKATSNAINVVSNAATHFSVVAPGSTTTRATFQITVNALDVAGNISAAYSGIVHFMSTDGNAILPANSTLTGGSGTFSATFESAGNQSITTTDAATTSISGSSNSVSVTASVALTITSGTPPSGMFELSYGPTTYLQCHWNFNRGIYLVCGSCTEPSGCSSLPNCTSFPKTGFCKRAIPGFPLTATGGVPPYKWSAAGLPPGLAVNSSNVLAGTPTSPGSYQVTVTLSDSGTPPVSPLPSNTYSIVINDPSPPTINATAAPPFGAVGLPYSFTFAASSLASPLTWSVSAGTLPPGLTLSPGGVLSGIPSATGKSSITLVATDKFMQNSSPQAFTIQIFEHGFQATGSMAGPRIAHTATLLNNGMVLVAGGTDGSGTPIATAELFNPATGSFTATGSLGTARAHFAATLLCDLSSLPCNDNRVLVTGGLDISGQPLTTAEIYDPATGKFAPTSASMLFVHASHTATLLKTGQVLIAGWGNAVAELYDPGTGTFKQTGNMATARVGHTATLLNTGKVLVTGGIQGAPPATTTLAEAELYDPGTGSFTATLGSLATARQAHTASLLSDGTVVVTGGLDSNSHALASAELFDPNTQMFTAAKGSMGTARAFHTATPLLDKTVLVTGGDDGTGPLATAELYDAVAETFSPTGSMGNTREMHTATLLNDGTVLVTGGIGSGAATAELYK